MLAWVGRLIVWFLVAKLAAWVAFFASIWIGAYVGEMVPALDPLIPWVIAGSWPGTLVAVVALLAYRHVVRTDRERARRQAARVPSAYTYTHAQAGK